MTLEERLSRIADLLAASRATNWTLGDEYAQAVRDHGKGVVSALAEVARCSTEHIRQCIRVSVAFPPEYRDPARDWSDYREILMAAKRGARNPVALLQECEEMSAAEIRLLYRNPDDKPPVLRFAARCPDCGRQVNWVEPTKTGSQVKCGICGAVLGNVE